MLSIGLGSGSVTNRRQAITWIVLTNTYATLWRRDHLFLIEPRYTKFHRIFYSLIHRFVDGIPVKMNEGIADGITFYFKKVHFIHILQPHSSLVQPPLRS